MTLEQHFLAIYQDNWSFSAKEQEFIQSFIENQQSRFQDICQKKDKDSFQLLLGLMTHLWQQEQDNLEHHRDAHNAMDEVLTHTIGKLHKQKFTNQDRLHFELLSQLYLAVQGATGIDISYANEQAEIAAETLNSEHLHQSRSSLLKHYYIGREYYQTQKPSWWRCLLKRLTH
ncbi:TPA: hypothetical protein ACX6QD_000434 [Photobacterium damselae]